MIQLISPKRPKAGAGWIQQPNPPAWVSLGYDALAFRHPARGLTVFSAVEVATDPGDISKGPEYHISISRDGKRCSAADARQVIADFDMDGAEEDNHVPNGIVRNWWRPVAEHLVGIECHCKDSEPKMVEDKGDYIWRGVPGGGSHG